MKRNGFTLTELMLALGVLSFVMAGSFAVYIACHKMWYSMDMQMQSMRKANMMTQKMVYGAFGTNGIRGAYQTNIVTTVSSNGGWALTYSTPGGGSYKFEYLEPQQLVKYTELSQGSNATVYTIASNITTFTLTPSTNGIEMLVKAAVKFGRFCSTSSATTYIQYRN